MVKAKILAIVFCIFLIGCLSSARSSRLRTDPDGFRGIRWGKNTEMTLSYSRDRHQGTLNINSKKIGEERRAYEKQKGR
jgi:hypothetical protein